MTHRHVIFWHVLWRCLGDCSFPAGSGTEVGHCALGKLRVEKWHIVECNEAFIVASFHGVENTYFLCALRHRLRMTRPSPESRLELRDNVGEVHVN